MTKISTYRILDAVSILVFAIIGRASHSESVGVAAIGDIAKTALPFWLGWFVAALLTRHYAKIAQISATSTIFNMRQQLMAILGNIIVTIPIAALLRYFIVARWSPWTFYVVATISLILFIFVARWLMFMLIKYKNP